MSEVKKSQNKSESNVNEFNRYLNNNIDILKEKFKEYYGQSFPLKQLGTEEEGEATIKYIYDIFNFSKYEGDKKLNNTLRSSLLVNINSFIQEVQETNKVFDAELAIKLLKYCIEHNDMFAVSYDKKKAQKKEEIEEQQGQSNKEEEIPKVEEPGEGEEPQEEADSPMTPQKSEQKESKAEEKEVNEINMNVSNQFGSPPQHSKIQNSDLIKKQLKGVFEFYCKQQQNVGPNFTFDNINHKCQTMNLGKFIAFTIAANIVHSRDKAYSEGKLEKNQLVSVFKKISEGVREIGFPTFLKIMEELKRNDSDIYDRLGLGQEGPKGMTKLNDKLKYINLPFGTRDSTGREDSRYNKVFVPKLTSHSGKSEDDLREELISRKQRGNRQQILQRPRASSKLEMSRNMQNSRANIANQQERTKFTLKLGHSNDLEHNDLNFLSKLITHQENDEIFLKQYKIPNSKPHYPRDRAQSNSYDDTHSNVESPKLFGKNIGGFTTRVKKHDDFVLPTIPKRGRITEHGPERRSSGPPRKGVPRLLHH